MKKGFRSLIFLNEFIPKSWICLKNYNLNFFKSDLIAGFTVGVVALPLAMAFAIASGLSPEKGIYTAIIAGFLISLLSGSRLQIGGPTGAFVVIIYEIVQVFGYEGLAVITLLAGVILLLAALFRLGALVKYIPYPLITGFTTGIAVIIFSSQIKDFFGLNLNLVPAEFISKWVALISAFPTLHLSTCLLSLGTLLFIIAIRRFFPVIPWGITAVVGATLISWGFNLPVETIESRFGSIPRLLPTPYLPEWSLPISEVVKLIPYAITVAFLAGIEALLSAVVADGMSGTRHKSNCELMAQGIANIGSILFGGIPATGAIARTATNIKTGAKTPVAGIVHAFTLLLILLVFAPLVSQIPLAALSAILIMVAWNMSEIHHFRHLFKAPKSDIIILLTTFVLTVFVDLTVAVVGGIIVALLLFMKKMESCSQVVSTKSIKKEFEENLEEKHLPPKVEMYEITGPFFFGIAESLKNILHSLEFPPKVFILKLSDVPWIDASGMHALRQFYIQCRREGTILYLLGVRKSVYQTLESFEIVDLVGEQNFFSSLRLALKEASQSTIVHD